MVEQLQRIKTSIPVIRNKKIKQVNKQITLKDKILEQFIHKPHSRQSQEVSNSHIASSKMPSSGKYPSFLSQFSIIHFLIAKN